MNVKKNAFSLCLAGTVLFGTVTTPALALSVDKLTDVSKNDWFYPYVQYVAEKEYMVGVAENTFAPNLQVTRAMFVTTLAALDGAGTSTAKIPFTDVSSNAWYANAVKWAYANGIVAGVSDTEFAPNAVISREQMCVMMSAFLNYRANKDDVTFKTTVDEKTFPDAASISTWAKDAVKKSQMWGLVAGDENGNMNPGKAATRAEAAVMLKQLDAVLAAGISNGGSSGGGGGDNTPSKTADYTVKVTVSVPDSIHTSDLELLASYDSVKIKGSNVTGDKTVSDVAKDLTNGENDKALVNAVSAALDKVTDKTTTRTIKGKTVTVTVDKDGKISATVEVQVTDLVGDEQEGLSVLALDPSKVSIKQMQDLLERLQNSNGSYTVQPDDDAVVQAIINKAEQLGEMDLEEIEQKKQQYIQENPSLEQALSGMTAQNIKEAAAQYKETLETEIQPNLTPENVGKEVTVKVEATTMNVAIDLKTYLDSADSRYEENRAGYIADIQSKLYPDGTTLTEDQQEKLEAMYDLYKPSNAVTVSEAGVVSLKTAREYTDMAKAYITSACDFYDSLGEDAEFYQSLLNRAENRGPDSYGISYDEGDAEVLAALLGDVDGIFVDADNQFRADVDAVITVEADDTSYGNLLSLITGRFSQADGLLPTTIPGLVDGTYTMTISIQRS